MAEKLNVETAPPHNGSEARARASFHAEILEIIEAIVLSVIAVATAWNGFQAAKWDGRQGYLYGTATRLRVEAAVASAEGGQRRIMDVTTFNSWIKEKESKDERTAAQYVHRFSPEYRIAFDAWLKTEPFRTPGAPPGPLFMPDYHSPLLEEAARLNQEATAAFAAGTEARVIAEQYVRASVLLAVVIFLVALAQRFKIRRVRIGLVLVASTVMVYALVNMASWPRLQIEPVSQSSMH
jgi:hypothetical protein